MRIRLLGTIEIADGREWVRVGTAKMSCVLARLAMSPGQVVPLEELIGQIWGTRLPQSAYGTIYSYVARLRRRLAPHDGVVLDRAEAGGYRLDIEPEQIDLFRMRALVSAAQSAVDGAVDAWRTAAALWRPPVLSGIEGDWAERTRAALHREHATVLTGWFDTELQAGRHVEVLARLQEETARYPQALTSRLMLALYRDGRAGEALTCYTELRNRLRDTEGTEPSSELALLQRRILRDDPTLRPTTTEVVVAEPASPNPAVPVRPAQLPAANTLIGRDRQVELICAQADEGGVIAVDGMAGIGKTTVAIHAARRLAASYPDGQLFLDLHGFTGEVPPAAPAEALDRMLRGLGIAGSQIPSSVEEMATLYRSVLSGRRMIIVLDNVATEEQVRPLLPGDPGNLVLITSRVKLPDLDDAARLSLETLSRKESVRLFERATGRRQYGPADRELIVSIVETCGRLPLAIRIAAARLRSRPHWSLTGLLQRLTGADQIFTELAIGQRSVAAAFNMSYAELDSEHQRLFRLLGLSVGADFGVHAAAAMVADPPDTVEARLDDLVDANLLMCSAPGRYQFHDLIRRYAADTAAHQEPAAASEAAVVRMIEMYKATAAVGAVLLNPHFTTLVETPTPDGMSLPRLHDHDAALRWFEAEHANLLAVVTRAAELGRHGQVVDMNRALWPYLGFFGYATDQTVVCRQGVRAARLSGNVQAEGTALNLLGLAMFDLNRTAEAERHLSEALSIRSRIEDHRGMAASLNNLGNMAERLGRLPQAIELYGRCIRITNDVGYEALEAMARVNCAQCFIKLRQWDRARAYLDQALAVFRRLGHGREIARANYNLAGLARESGDPRTAFALYQDMIRHCREHEGPIPLGHALTGLGAVHRDLGDLRSSMESLRDSLKIGREHRSHLQAAALVELGHTRLALGEAEAALRAQREAIKVAGRYGLRYERACAQHGIAAALERLGDTAGVRRYIEAALASYRQLQVPPPAELQAAHDMA